MNFVFVSPHFPHTYWQFCDRLHRNGINVLGIGDAPYDSLEGPLKAAMTEYYRVAAWRTTIRCTGPSRFLPLSTEKSAGLNP